MEKTMQNQEFNVEKRSVGRPTEWPAESAVWGEVLTRMSSGKSLSSVLREPGMPPWTTFQRMLRNNNELRDAYDKAVQDRADRLADEIIELADERPPDGLEGPSLNAWVQQKRLQVDARKWVASKLKPKTYGDRLDVSVVDTRISVLDALNEAKQRVIQDSSNIIDVETKTNT